MLPATVTHDGIDVTKHASKRWKQRSSFEVSICTAWKRSLNVLAPEVDGNARLYPPDDILIIQRDTAIKTVLPADYGRLNLRGNIRCPNCENVDDPLEGETCSWCGATMQLGGVSIHTVRG